ncbi:protein timeless-like [Daphnia pulicaria]|uniref:protein timeless-like n=1 Tax=Daphnia pulicaria TaxID=35523 RepID=UPI001EEAA8D5|nr:protein timeless-like [Daphnia pulicaria]
MDEWVKLSGNVPSLSLVSLGAFHNSKYYASNECLDCLNEINAKLNDKGPHTYPLRRALIFMDFFNKDLIPILIHVNQPNIIRSTIKLLVQMTLPVGCLVSGESIVQQPNETSMSKHFVHELTNFLYVAKETFVLNPLATRSIFEHLNCLLANVPQQAMSKDDCESVSYFLLLIRNIVHAPEGVRANQSASVGDSATYFAAAASPGHWQQRRLLSDLLTQGLDLLLIDLLTCFQKPSSSDTLKVFSVDEIVET